MTSPSTGPGESRLERIEELDHHSQWLLVTRTVATSVGVIAAIVTAYYVAPWDGGRGRAIAIRTAISLVVLLGVAALAVPYIVRAKYPTLRAAQALVALVGLAVVSFASVYLLISTRDPAAFTEPLNHTDALYFSLTTSTTIGYGDISATSESARIVVMTHMLTNVIVIGVAVRVFTHVARRRVEAR